MLVASGKLEHLRGFCVHHSFSLFNSLSFALLSGLVVGCARSELLSFRHSFLRARYACDLLLICLGLLELLSLLCGLNKQLLGVLVQLVPLFDSTGSAE